MAWFSAEPAVTRVSKEHIGQCVREHHDITSESGIAQFVTEHKPDIASRQMRRCSFEVDGDGD